MSDSTGNSPYGGQPSDPAQPSQQQPPAYPPPQQNPYGQPPAAPDSAAGSTSGGTPGTGADQPFGQPTQAAPYGQYGQSPYGAPQYGQPAYGAPAGDPDKRPGTVTAAGVVTILLSGMVLIGCLLGAAGLAIARGEIVRQIQSDPAFDEQVDFSGIDAGSIVTIGIVALGLFLLWALLAIVLAIFAMRRSNGARIALVVSSVLSGILSLLAVGALFPVLWVIGAIVVVVCLFTGGAGAWYSRSGSTPTGRGGLSAPVA